MFRELEAKILDGSPNYFVIEDIGHVSSINQFEKLLQAIHEHVQMKDIQSVKIVLNEKEASNNDYLHLLGNHNYLKHDTQYFFERDLNSLENTEQVTSIELKSMEQTTNYLFKKVWKEVVTGSLNASSSLSIEKEFEGMKAELGSNYIKNCLIAYHDKDPIGITIPHIEPGTIDEGRLFYFGLVPAFRGNKWGITLHKLSLHFLKSIGATYYIGATGHRNIPMQRIFQLNGCRMIEKKVIFRYIPQTQKN